MTQIIPGIMTPSETYGPIGGGAGYRAMIDRLQATVIVSDRHSLVSSLTNGRRGDIIYVDDSASIDLTGSSEIAIPGGVTLAGGRGKPWAGGGWAGGGLLFSNDIHPLPLFKVQGDKVRITGLRIRGPFDGIGDDTSPSRDAILADGFEELEVDNCQLFRWPSSCVAIRHGKAGNNFIHNNFIHDNKRYGRGYGIVLTESFALIEANLFNHNRHSIAGSGLPGEGYEARHNIVLANPTGHCFDMHGGFDRRDGTDVAGDWIYIHHNLFYETSSEAVLIRGKPRIGCLVEWNVFNHMSIAEAVKQSNALGHLTVQDNTIASRKLDLNTRTLLL